MADSNVAALQSAINRFASVGGFGKVGVDGNWGEQTRTGVKQTLSFIGKGGCVDQFLFDQCADIDDQRTANGLTAQWDGGPSSASGMATFMNRVADSLGLAYVAAPIVVSAGGGGGSGVPITPNPYAKAVSVSLIDKFKALPMWQKLALGALAGLGLLWGLKRFRGSGSLSGLGASELHLFTYRNRHGSWSDVWAPDVKAAMAEVRRRKNSSGFVEISRVRNVPPRVIA